jgi:hypothetical protein
VPQKVFENETAWLGHSCWDLSSPEARAFFCC